MLNKLKIIVIEVAIMTDVDCLMKKMAKDGKLKAAYHYDLCVDVSHVDGQVSSQLLISVSSAPAS